METNLMEQHKIISYLTFRLGEESFAFNVAKVINILEHSDITKVPQAPDYMKGIINLRGEVLPVIDTNHLLGLGQTNITHNTCILVLKTTLNNVDFKMGALVDAVEEVLEIQDNEILAPPSIGEGFKSVLLNGVYHMNDHFIMIVNVNEMLDQNMIQELQEMKQQSENQTKKLK